MNNKQQFDFYQKHGILKEFTAEMRLKSLSDALIQMLYTPKEDDGLFYPDWEKIERLGIDKSEPINWADLKSSVENKGEYYLITIDEASPRHCLTLCEYIENYLTAWGWTVRVETEW